MELLILIVGGAVVFALAALALYAVIVQRRAVSKVLPAQDEGLALARESIELQREANRLLAIIAKASERERT